jgi:hypothetical protein
MADRRDDNIMLDLFDPVRILGEEKAPPPVPVFPPPAVAPRIPVLPPRPVAPVREPELPGRLIKELRHGPAGHEVYLHELGCDGKCFGKCAHFRIIFKHEDYDKLQARIKYKRLLDA